MSAEDDLNYSALAQALIEADDDDPNRQITLEQSNINPI
jgi:hypothetical protein